MQRDKFKTKPVKAEAAFNIVPQNAYLDPEYVLETPQISAVTETGLLAVLRLVPTVPGLPTFAVRWDDKQNTIDVDLQGNSFEKAAFRAERNGYKGHHPVTVSADPRVFKIDVQLPQRKVYEALLTCNIGHGVAISATLEMKAEFSATLSPAPTEASQK